MTDNIENLKLSKNFSYKEMIGRRPDNEPPKPYLINLVKLCVFVLQPIREKFGKTIVTSGYRNPDYNRSVFGSPNSQHIKGQAADIIVPEKDLKEIYLWIKDNLEYDQMIYENNFNTIWIHISYNDTANRKETLLCKQGVYSKFNGIF